MTKKFLATLVFCVLVSFAQGAITERYVTSTGSDTYANSTNIATPMSLTTAVANAAAGDRINIKNDGVYTRAASDTVTNAATATSPIIWRGYASVIGDGNLGRTSGNGALITTNMPNIAYNAGFKFTTSVFNIVESVNFTTNTTGTSSAVLITGADSAIKSCRVINTSTNALAIGVSLAADSVVFDSDVELTGGSGGKCAVDGTNSNTKIIANRIKGGPNGGVLISTAAGMDAVVDNVIFAQAGIGISDQSNSDTSLIYGNTIVGGTGSAKGIDIVTGGTKLRAHINNIITDNATYGSEYNSTGNAVFEAYTRYRDNTTANTHNAGDWLTATSYGNVTSGNGTSDYTNAGSSDYSLILTSPAKAAGWFQYLDIGALQRQEPVAGGSTPTRIPSIGN